ncbi:site-specific DNA-methyltransferase [Anaerobutyricum hallii]|uniref:DNA (Cytosine-5-)-methyltransferase n=1 Tax=Anaerobutyricum hallii DSM 3353 TaxID=411469 RepID=C0ESW4_9FIRM|nr:site-specific DNA-methyltransferase [Anaerobutyricum hallii]EEG37706.1 DNA (cytosine-5-)-methyltransferase [Anaerobutyricum hallii DSM 3353]QUF79635.1 site-specific DNA-methyltransferase [Anaerobutyricum hallii]
MDKMRMESVDMTAQNIEKIGSLFPNCITETIDENGKGKKVINFELLKQMLSSDVIDGDEAYEFTWVGKKASIVEANKPIRKTLRPCKEESVDWDNTENLYIEGDNLEVLKLLQESYLNKVKMIYIDPPYNTGNDFIYNDDFKMTSEEYAEEISELDEDGNRMFKNTDTNGRFHSDWCSMIYSRLMLARNLLSDDGVIFISIDDNEQSNLKKCCEEIFGEKNFVAQLIWERAFAPKNDAKYISNSHDYILMFAKNINNFVIGRLPRTSEANARYSNPDNDPRGVWQSDNLTVKTYSPSGDYSITTPSGRVVEPPAGRCWSLSKNKFLERLKDNRIWFGADGNGVPRIKRFLSELKFEGMAPTSLLFFKEVGHSQEGSQELIKIMDGGVFDGPKPTRLLKRLMILANLKENSIVLDFFSGSATTAHALMEVNKEKNLKCKYIMVQLAENTNKKKDTGYKNICEIGKERIRRAGKKIKEEAPLVTQNLDIGFRVLKLDDSNMNEVYYSPDDYSQGFLNQLESNIKEDRTDLDLLFGCLLDWGLPLSLPYYSEQIEGCTVHNYNDGDLIACFDENIPNSVIKEIAKKEPLRAVFRDSSFASSSSKINVGEIFKLIAPDTTVKVI